MAQVEGAVRSMYPTGATVELLDPGEGGPFTLRIIIPRVAADDLVERLGEMGYHTTVEATRGGTLIDLSLDANRLPT